MRRRLEEPAVGKQGDAMRTPGAPDPGRPFQVDAAGVRLAVRLTPNAARDEIGAVSLDAAARPQLAIRIRAPAVDGAANAALIAFLAKTLKLRRSDITIIAGETARTKRLALAGDGPAIARKLEHLLANEA